MTTHEPPRIWTVPLIIAVLSIAALVIALLDDGVWDVVASLTLAATLVFGCYKGFTQKG